MADDKSLARALVPIAEALPEIAAEDYDRIREWDDRFMQHEAASGAYLARIRDALTQGKYLGSGLWTRYLKARGLNERTARERIQKAEGRYSKRLAADTAAASLPEPDPVEIYGRAKREAEQLAQIGDYQAAERRLSEGYEAAVGIYLAKIRAVLAPEGRWETYLLARSLDPRTVEKCLRAAATWAKC